MSHTPFIVSAYAVFGVVLLWCAFAPLMRKKAAIRKILTIKRIEESKIDSNA
jgi:heme exporter protein CcmD